MTMPAIKTLLRQPAAQAVAWALLQFIWQGAAIGVLTALTLAALRRSDADVRYLVASISLSVMLTLPVVTGVQKYQSLRHDAETDVSARVVAAEGAEPATTATPASVARAATSTTVAADIRSRIAE